MKTIGLFGAAALLALTACGGGDVEEGEGEGVVAGEREGGEEGEGEGEEEEGEE